MTRKYYISVSDSKTGKWEDVQDMEVEASNSIDCLDRAQKLATLTHRMHGGQAGDEIRIEVRLEPAGAVIAYGQTTLS